MEHSKETDLDNIERIRDYVDRYGNIVIPIIIDELVKKKSDKILSQYEYLLKYLDNFNLVKPLIGCLITNKDNNKLRKTIIKVLKYYYISFTDPPLNRFYAELIQEIEKLKIELLDSYSSENWYKFIELYSDFLYLEEGQTEILKSIEKTDNDNKFDIFLTMLLTNNDFIIKSIIEALGRIDNEKSVMVLKKAQVFLPLKYHSLIELNIRKLNFKGIRYNQDLEEENNIVSAYLGFPFSNGLRHLLYLVKKNQRYHILFIEMDEVFGITDNCFLYHNLDEKKKELILFNKTDQFYLKKVENNYDLKIMNDAVFNSYVLESAFPPVFSVFINFLPSYYFKPVLYNWEKIRERFNIPLDENLVKDSTRLWELVDILGWLSEDSKFIDIVERWYANSKKEDYYWMDEIFVKKILREIILSDINIWKERLLLLADFLDNINEHKEYINIILALERIMSKDIERMEKVPFFRRLIIESKMLVLNRL